MRNKRLIALRTLAQLGQFQNAVISPAHALPALRWFTLRDTHILYFKLKLQLIQL